MYLSVKGNQRILSQIYDPIRVKSVEMLGILPRSMQPTTTSHLAIFVWSLSKMGSFTDENLLSAFSGVVSFLKLDVIDEKKSVEEDVKSEYGSATKLTPFEHDALQVIHEGYQSRYENIYAPMWAALAERGFLKQSGLLNKTYALTTKGDMARRASAR